MTRSVPLPFLSALLAALVFLVAPGAARATLIGQTVGVALTDGGALSLQDSVAVGAGAEITPGDGSAIGGVLLPLESVDVQAQSIVLTIEEGAPGGATGYGPGTHYTLSNLVFFDAPTQIVGIQVSSSNVSNLGVVSFTASSVTVPLDTLTIGEIPGVNFGTVSVLLDVVVVPEPGTASLVALGATGVALLRRRRSAAR